LAASPVHADDKLAAARAYYIEATRAFGLEQYDDAAKEYTAAYRAKPDPALLYDIAQAERLANHPAQALRFYRLYLAHVPQTENRAEVETKIAELTRTLDEQKQTRELQARPPPVEKPVPPAAPSDRPPGRAKEIAGITVGAVGVAALAAGIAFGVLAHNTGDDVTAASKSGAKWSSSQDSTGETDQTAEGVLLGVGSAALVAGVVLYVLGHREASAARVAVVPSVSTGRAGLSLHLRF
jgi:hypothetical protein